MVVIACSACSRKNRIPPRHLVDEGRCGACGAALPPLDRPLDVDAATFDAVVSQASVPVLVDFWAAWCAPCRAAAPHVARAAERLAGRGIVLKVDTERETSLAARYGIQSIPNFVVLRDGVVRFRQAGLSNADQLVAWVEAA